MNTMRRIEDSIYYRLAGPDWTGDGHLGGATVPGDHLDTTLIHAWHCPVRVDVRNDGHELGLWLDGSSEMSIMLRHEQARQLAWFILWRWWVLGTWCGLRRKLWYWALHCR